ncbi:hypothetical protein ANCCAN_17137 [Ancylostoma caninum]|uniref:Uncharacterized protein n=1 Tax=Ancylostoma caninum TaxID=29170 RepID=A0A368FXS8_ANCCA|nr:hypothetical protein ANCCAN_17137 [Ancylostoma caninum]
MQENVSIKNVKEQSSVPQTSPATSRDAVRDGSSQSKDDRDSSPSVRKHKGVSNVQDSEEPSLKKQKQELSAQSTGKLNPALASLVKFKVAPSGMKKSTTLLKQAGLGDKDSTDLEEEKGKEPSTQSTGKLNPALASLVKFKVAPSGMKKSTTLLKQAGLGDKDSTDLEEEKGKVVADDDTSVDRRMREAFSPPKLQRKKITLNL